jgi:hypothetical protein
MIRVTDHCIAQIVRRTGCLFDYDEIREQIAILIFAAGCGVEHIQTCDGIIIIEDDAAVTFLEPGMRPKKKRRLRRKYL